MVRDKDKEVESGIVGGKEKKKECVIEVIG